MKILVVDDETAARYAMAKALRGDNRTILEAADGAEALDAIRQQAPDLVFLDLNMPDHNGMWVLDQLSQTSGISAPEIIIVTANEGLTHAVECIRAGATDYITKPYDVEHIRSIARRTEKRVQLQTRLAELQVQRQASADRFGRLIGISQPMRRLADQVSRAAPTDLPILICGESGTGKELVAREIHERSARADQPFVAVNTAALPESLVESELFGHVKGAYTGADREREGVFRKADGGTLFLDEIGDMPTSVQTRLLRVLQEGLVQPVGSEQTIRVNVRIISATHQNLEEAIQENRFRQDLYFRLKGIELFLPPLRARHEDILLLARHFATNDVTLSSDAVSAMLNHTWPGNVRELQQMISAACALCTDGTVTRADLNLPGQHRTDASPDFNRYLDLPLTEARQLLVEEFERAAIRRALDAESSNISAAARRLGIHRQSLQQKMRQLKIR